MSEDREPVASVTVYQQTEEVIYFATRECATFTVEGEQGQVCSNLDGTMLVRFRGKQYAVQAQDVVRAILETLGLMNEGEG